MAPKTVRRSGQPRVTAGSPESGDSCARHDWMSIIGPRPERPEFLELLEREVPFWARRVLIKPGITGWAQVQGGYASGTVGAADKLSYDLYYLKHRSMLLNFAIVAKTAATVVSRSGAR